MDLLDLLTALTDTSTASTDLGSVVGAVWDTVQAFGVGAVEGLLALSGALFLASRLQGLELTLAPTRFDWAVWSVRALSVLATGTLTGVLASEGNALEGAVGGLVGAVPLALRYIHRTYEEATD